MYLFEVQPLPLPRQASQQRRVSAWERTTEQSTCRLLLEAGCWMTSCHINMVSWVRSAGSEEDSGHFKRSVLSAAYFSYGRSQALNGQTFDSRHSESGTPDFAVDNGEIPTFGGFSWLALSVNMREMLRIVRILRRSLGHVLCRFSAEDGRFVPPCLARDNSNRRVFVHLGDLGG